MTSYNQYILEGLPDSLNNVTYTVTILHCEPENQVIIKHSTTP